MRLIIKRVTFVAAIIVIFSVSTVHLPPTYSLESTAEDKLSDFLSSVVGLDLTKYASPPPSLPPGYEDINLTDVTSDLVEKGFPNPRYPSEFGGIVEQEILSYELEYSESKIYVMSIFYNGHMVFLDISPQGSYIYSKSPPTDNLNQAKSIIQKYQTFASKNYATDASFLVPMQNLLSNVNDLSPTEITDGNINFQISKNGDDTHIQWIYTENGVSMEYKRVGISFHDNILVSFVDTWSIYSVSGLSVISSEEAVQIALEAAQNCELRIGHEDRETEIVKVPDLSNAPYSVNMYMVPFRYQERDIPSKIARDPLTLYPYWQVHFYFNESIAGMQGVQVGVWGDTSEIIYCSGFGFFGAPMTTNEPLGEQNQPNTMNPSTLAIVASLIAVPIISISAIALRRKNWHKQRT